MGLILGRTAGQELVIYAKPGTDPALLAEQLANGITIRINAVDRGKTWLDITAPLSIKVLRTELLDREP